MRSFLIPVVSALVLQGAPDVQSLKLPNGLRIILKEDHTLPIVRLDLRSLWAASEVPTGKEGAMGMLGLALRRCQTGSLSRDAFEGFLAEHALEYNLSVQPDALGWSVRCDSRNQEAAFQSLSLSATRPVLTAAQTEQVRQYLAAQWAGKSTAQQAEAAFRRRVADPDWMLMPDDSSLARIEAADLETLIRRVVRPEKSILIVQGDLNLSQVKQMASLHLGAWGPTLPAPLGSPAEGLSAARPLVRAWLSHATGKPIRISVGSSRTPWGMLSAADFEVVQRILRKRAVEAIGSSEERLELVFHPNGAWRLDLQARRVGTLRETAKKVLGLLDVLRNRELRPQELQEATRTWKADQALAELHPRLVAEDRVQSAVQQISGRTFRRLDPATFQDLASQSFDPKSLHYLITGDAPDAESILGVIGWTPLTTAH